MKFHDVDLASLTTYGKVKTNVSEGVLDVWTTQSITPVSFNLYGDSFKRHYVSLPENHRLPFRIDMTVKLDYPSFLLFIGNGHISFASPWQDNRKIEDIAFPSGKPKSYNNSLPLGEWTDISVTYNMDEMQILINGEERFTSRKLPYMSQKNRHEFEVMNIDGFSVGLAVSKLSVMSIKSITVTEYEEAAPIEHSTLEEIKIKPEMQDERPKLTLESVISELPQGYQDEVIETDSFLKLLRPIKFKRAIDKGGGKISWVASDYGISYHIEPSGHQLSQRFGWYVVYNGTPDTWHRKSDDMEETLNYISKSDPNLARRMFYALNDCVACYGARCLVKTLYEFDGQKRLACHGTVMLRMSHDDFNDAREFFRYLNALMEEKDGISTEKIYLTRP